MSDHYLRAMAARARSRVQLGRPEYSAASMQLDVERYLSPAMWQQEKAALFGPLPLIAERSEALAAGQALERRLVGRSIVLTRDAEGRAHAFLNACRHRGMQLLEPGAAQCKSRLNCPYHGWSYGLDGSLRGMPHREAFPTLDWEELKLVALPCSEAHGFVWVQPDAASEPVNLQSWLAGLDADFTALELAEHRTYREARSLVQANWKLCVDAFLEAYHVQVLHRNTVAPFFEDALAVYDIEGQHYRSGVARKGLDLDGVETAPMSTLRDLISYTHFVFPNQFFIFHPDYVSQMSILPRDESSFEWVHRMLIPAAAQQAELEAHWEKSYRLIEEGVFQAEDLKACERIHAGLLSGANRQLQLGALEPLVQAFHTQLDQCLGRRADPQPVPLRALS